MSERTGQETSGRAARFCRAIVRREARNFYYAFRFLPPDRRQAMYALYAFCRIADDVADEPMPDAVREERFQALEAGLDEAAAGRPDGLLFTALAPVLSHWEIPVSEPLAVIRGCRQDTWKRRYETREELDEYCHLVAGVVGAMTMRIFGVDPDRHPGYVYAGGTAVQMTNILRDVAEDAERDRIYLPLEDLRRHGVAQEDVLAGRPTPAFRRMMAEQVARVRRLYREADEALPVDVRSRISSLGVIQSMYPRILDEIEDREYDVFGPRIRIPTFQKLWAAFSFYLRRWLPFR